MQYLVRVGKQRPKLGYLFALISQITLAIMQTLFKYATRTLPSFQLLALRSAVLVLVNCYVMARAKVPTDICNHSVFKLAITRVSVVGAASSMMFYCLSYIPVSTVITLFNTGPIFIFFIEAVAYRKGIRMINLLLVLLSFLGVVLIVQPEFIFGSTHVEHVQGFYFYILLMLLSASANALNLHFVHGLSKSIHPFVNMFYSHVGFLIINSFMCNLYPAQLEPEAITPSFILIMLAIIFFGFVTQFLIYLANALLKPSLVMPLGYVCIVVGFLADVYLFGIDFGFLPMLGILMTSAGLLSGYLVSKGEESRKPSLKDVSKEIQSEQQQAEKEELEQSVSPARV